LNLQITLSHSLIMKLLKVISTFIFLMFITVSCIKKRKTDYTKAKPNNVFRLISYDNVVAYNYNGDAGNEIIDEEGHLSKKIKKKATLTKSQIIWITNVLCEESTYGGPLAACFDPHLGIVFYKKNTPVAHVSICLACNYLSSSIKIPAAESGFSDAGSNKIVDFAKKLHL
jgi:hypothetical protein